MNYYDCQGKLIVLEHFTSTSGEGQMCDYKKPCKKGLVCASSGICTPGCGVRYGKVRCQDGYICYNGECKLAEERDDMELRLGTSCQFSGKGIHPIRCEFSTETTEKCGVNHSYTRCKPGLFCNDQGQCVEDPPSNPKTENCRVYSGRGVRSCRRKVSTNNTCGPNNGWRSCPPGMFCSDDGLCTNNAEEVKDKKSPICMKYSGEGIVNCSLPAGSVSSTPPSAYSQILTPLAPGRMPLRIAPTPPPAPAVDVKQMQQRYSKLQILPDAKIQVAKTFKFEASSGLTLDNCLAKCNNNRTCTAMNFTPTPNQKTGQCFTFTNVKADYAKEMRRKAPGEFMAYKR